ncbi:hypothetical protein SAMN02745671_00154 [Anaerovibrio lipolyticus DSM 3074]|uniref:Lipoprotein n=2 Tax=Anaerovibrio lipolyticus TaxID=82374 RepID=A0A0B2JKM3_9FIRM|nr:hypothetical protein [Anaerovibrio lipolyticus]KHM47263.1 hypothetical protein NZ47_13640 [Anaerovibrio lipolyticus]SHI30157.1 hypothetical protein SAMN02745671_00154 [Anaerovibrio lipolyticus DSM 3074]
MKKSLFITLCILAILAVSLLIGGCGSKNDENMDASYYRKILMLPDGQLLCSLEVEADKVNTAGAVCKVEKKDGKIRRITALYDGQKPDQGFWTGYSGVLSVLDKADLLSTNGYEYKLYFHILEISEDGDDLLYTETGTKQTKEIRRFIDGVKGKPTSIKSEGKLQYDAQGRCTAITSSSKRTEFGYTGDSVLPTSIVAYNSDGKKLALEIPLMTWDEHNRITKVVIKGDWAYDEKLRNKEKFAGDEAVGSLGWVKFDMAEMTQAFYEGDNPNPISVRAYKASGTPTRSRKTGVHEYAYRYDDKYNMISVEALVGKNVKEPVMAIPLGESKDKKQKFYCATCRFAYDEKGRRVAWATYGKDGRPVNGASGYAEEDKFYGDDGSFSLGQVYFGTLGQPINRNSGEKDVPNYHISIFIDMGDGKSETHYFNMAGEWLGVNQFEAKEKNEFTTSRFNKDSDLEKLAKKQAQPIILGKMGLMQFVHEEKDIPEATPKQTDTASTNTTVMLNSPLKAKDLTLGKLSIGDNTSTIRSSMGKPIEVVTENGQLHWKYHEIDITLVNDTISTLISNSPGVFTPRGIHEDSSIDDVFKNYGKDYRYEEYNNIQLYEYPITSKDGAPCLLRFAVKKGENKVYYISMRKI